MDATQLKRLAHVSAIAKIELSPRPVTLSPTSRGILSFYAGQFSAAAISLSTGPSTLSRAVSVGAKELTDAAAVFGKEEVTLTPHKSELVIETPLKRVKLRYRDEPDIELLGKFKDAANAGVLPLHIFKAEFLVAAAMAAVDYSTSSSGILQGVRIRLSSQGLELYSSDGISVFYHATIPLEGWHRDLDVIVPAKDIKDTIGILTGDKVWMGLFNHTFVLRGEDAILRLPTMPGQWPLPNEFIPTGYTDSVLLSAQSIRSLVAGSKLYKTSDIVMRPAKSGGVVLETPEGESGQLQELVKGSLLAPCKLSLTNIQQAALLTTDGLVQLWVGQQQAYARTDGNQRRLLLRMRA